MMYRAICRTWRKRNPKRDDGYETSPGEPVTLRDFYTWQEAHSFCQEWNREHEMGDLCRIAETQAIRYP